MRMANWHASNRISRNTCFAAAGVHRRTCRGHGARAAADVRLRIYSDAYARASPKRWKRTFRRSRSCSAKRISTDLAAEYIATHDSRFSSIRYYGDELAQFLASSRAIARCRSSPISRAGNGRWRRVRRRGCGRGRARALANKSPGDWATMRLTFHPSVRVAGVRWNAPQIWKAVIEDSGTPAAPRSRAKPCSWLLWRHDLKEFFRPSTPPEEDALAAALCRRNIRRRLRGAVRARSGRRSARRAPPHTCAPGSRAAIDHRPVADQVR